jgi:hypothetical protein
VDTWPWQVGLTDQCGTDTLLNMQDVESVVLRLCKLWNERETIDYAGLRECQSW